MSCPTIQTINDTECIGASLPKINSNYEALRVGVCDNQTQIISLSTIMIQLSSNMNSLANSFPYARFAEVYTSGVAPAALTRGTMTLRAINTQEYAASFATLNAGSNSITINSAGNYRIKINSQAPEGNSVNRYLILGLYVNGGLAYQTPANFMAYASYPDILDLSLDTQLSLAAGNSVTVRVGLSQPFYGGSGGATTATYNPMTIAGINEKYAQIEFWKLS